MTGKPTYEELRQRIKALEEENLTLKQAAETPNAAIKMVADDKRKAEALIESLGDAIAIVNTDFIFLYQNRVHIDYYGKHIGELCYKAINNRQEICEDCPVAESFGDGKTHTKEIVLPAGEGRLYVENTASPLKNTSGGIIAGIEIIRDITRRKQAEYAIRKSKEQYQSLVDNIDLGIAGIDSDHNVVMVNAAQARMFNKPVSELLGKKCFQEFEKRRTVCPHCPGVRAMNLGKSAEVETKGIRDDGSSFSVRIRAFPTFAHDGTVTGFIEVVDDITERKRIQEQLQKLERLEAIGTLAGGVAHDFNNLLMSIQGNVSMMLFDVDLTHPHYKFLSSIKKEVISGAKLTAQLLGYARKGKYLVEPINLNQLVVETSEAFGRTKKNILIHTHLAEDLFAVQADKGQIEQVLLNMLVNAGDAMPAGGNLILKTANVFYKGMMRKVYHAKPGKYVELLITDTGKGMDKETMGRIFEPFFTTKEMGRGTGLGLASAYGIIKSHGGYVEVDSEPDKGTTFSIYLPATKKKIDKTAKESRQVIKGTGTILLVDDEERVLQIGTKLLERLGYTVLAAKDGREAIEIYSINKDKIDLVILDMVMPVMGGGKTYDILKKINPEVKVLLSSGYNIDSEAKNILARGCDAFIQKPFGLRELTGKIGMLLENE